jgi:hypothetical protein
VAVYDADFQTDPVALDVSELGEGLYGDVDGLLDEPISISNGSDWEGMKVGTYVVVLSRGNIHHARAATVCQDVRKRPS